ncbi:MAG TPA: holo-ACP synthase [Verrucomicrobiota bacterium]|nr:holo-ACP synthase [Verrucomicrobiota bacterium]HOK78075.1 holo-ACP synthase [Verrucomicrobiota bacterium]
MIVGVGIDLVEVARVARACDRFGDRFLRRLFLEEEIRYCQSFADPSPHLAARFAAKEAVSKAFGTGIGPHLGWQDIEVRRRESGQPYVVLHGKGARLLEARGGRLVHLSLTHTESHAAAVAVIEGVQEPSIAAR